jgi:hypothetical protein
MLQDAGILITLTLRQWQARKLDRKVSLEVCEDKGAAINSGNFHKILISKHHLQPITQIVNKIRNYHYANTLAWSHKGIDFLPSKHYMTYMDAMGTLKDKFETEVEKFIKIYPTLINDSALELQSLYNADDYPSAETIRERFFMDINATPVPQSGDFRIDLPAKEMDKIKQKLDLSLKKAEYTAALDLYSRFYTNLAKTCLALADPNKIFRNTLIFNVEDIAKKIETMDITKNDTLLILSKETLALCSLIQIDKLREDTNYRGNICLEFKTLLTSVEVAYETFQGKE